MKIIQIAFAATPASEVSDYSETLWALDDQGRLWERVLTGGGPAQWREVDTPRG